MLSSTMGTAWRIGWMVISIVIVQSVVCGVALLPIVLLWSQMVAVTSGADRIVAISVALVPSYVLFALLLMFASAVTARTLGWRTPANYQMRIASVEWPLLRWASSVVACHIVRLFAGALFRGSPVWTAYLRLRGHRAPERRTP